MRILPAVALLASGITGFCSAGQPEPRAIRIGIVTVQDRSREKNNYESLDAALAELFHSAGFDTTSLPFQPPADLEYSARQAQCDYILYTDVVRIGKSIQWRLARMLGGMGAVSNRRLKPSSTEQSSIADVEFRLFALDEVLPRISTTVSGRSGRQGGPWSPAAKALLSALERVVRMVSLETRTARESPGSAGFASQPPW